MALQTQVRLRSRGNPLFRRHKKRRFFLAIKYKQVPVGCFLASSGWIRGPPATAEPLARPRPQKKTNHRNHQPHHSTHQPRPAVLGWEPSHPERLIRSPTDQKDRLSTRTHLFRPPRRAAGCACRAARLGCGSGSCTRNRAGCGPVVGSWLGFAP